MSDKVDCKALNKILDFLVNDGRKTKTASGGLNCCATAGN